MKKIALLLTLMLFAVSATWAQGETKADTVRHQVMLQTTKGNIVVELYNETPRHRDNFLKLVRSGYYNGILFHRVIADFMIQAGDSTSRHAKPGTQLGRCRKRARQRQSAAGVWRSTFLYCVGTDLFRCLA